MSWKCPECGNIENTDDQTHCLCGREVSDAELAVAKVEASRILAAGKDQPEDEPEPDGFTYIVRTFQFIALISGIIFNYYASINFRPVLTSLSIFILMALVLTDSIHRKQISMKYRVEGTPRGTLLVILLFQ